jgi:hypothetical protein
MGICVGKHFKTQTMPSTSSCNCRTLEEMKESVVYHILRLHYLMLKCRRGVESSVLKCFKDAAVVLKGKEIYISNKLESFRELAKMIDEYLSIRPQSKKEKQQLLSLGSQMVKELSSSLLLDDIDHLVTDNRIYLDQVRTELKKYYFDEEKIIILVEGLIQNRICCDKANLNRRKYNKDLKLII